MSSLQTLLPQVEAPLAPSSLDDLFLNGLPPGPTPLVLSDSEFHSIRLHDPPPWEAPRPEFHKLPVPAHECKQGWCKHFGVHPENLLTFTIVGDQYRKESKAVIKPPPKVRCWSILVFVFCVHP